MTMAANDDQREGRLDGWDEIAKHFNISASTARKWHFESSMPVRRWPGSQRICAWVSELDAWYAEAVGRGAVSGDEG